MIYISASTTSLRADSVKAFRNKNYFFLYWSHFKFINKKMRDIFVFIVSISSDNSLISIISKLNWELYHLIDVIENSGIYLCIRTWEPTKCPLTPISSILSILGRISSLSANHVQFLISTLGGWMWQIIFHVCNNRWLSSVCQAPGHNNIMVRDDKQNCYHSRITDAGHWNSFKPPPIGTKSTRPVSITTGYK